MRVLWPLSVDHVMASRKFALSHYSAAAPRISISRPSRLNVEEAELSILPDSRRRAKTLRLGVQPAGRYVNRTRTNSSRLVSQDVGAGSSTSQPLRRSAEVISSTSANHDSRKRRALEASKENEPFCSCNVAFLENHMMILSPKTRSPGDIVVRKKCVFNFGKLTQVLKIIIEKDDRL